MRSGRVADGVLKIWLDFSGRLPPFTAFRQSREDADYEGHSLAMLNRIAAAVQRRVEIRFVPRKRRLQPV